MKNIWHRTLRWIGQNKLKISCYLLATFFFIIFLFPYNDLGDLVSSQVAKLTNDQVYVQFDSMGFSLYPQPGLALEKVYVESPFAPPISVSSLAIAPSLRGLITFKPGVTIYAQDFLSGNLGFSTRGGDKTPKGEIEQVMKLQADAISLQKLLQMTNSPVEIRGLLNGVAEAKLDPTFQQQPEGEFDFKIEKFSPPVSIPTPYGAFNLPSLEISSLHLLGRLVQGEAFLDEVRIGGSGDQLTGNITGRLRLTLNRRGVSIAPQYGEYEFTVNLKVLPDFEKKASTILSFLDAYKKPGIGSTEYAFKLSGSSFSGMPKIVAQ